MVGVLIYAFGFGLGLLAAGVGDDSTPCIPGNAVDYDGTAHAWFDRQDRAVLLAEAEDTYDWCTRP